MNLLQKIRLYFTLKKSFDELKKEAKKEVVMNGETKPGYKTTEFWMTVCTNIVSIVGMLKDVIPPQTAAIIIAVVNGIYGVLRTHAKKS